MIQIISQQVHQNAGKTISTSLIGIIIKQDISILQATWLTYV
jgi:hypothetical protein